MYTAHSRRYAKRPSLLPYPQPMHSGSSQSSSSLVTVTGMTSHMTDINRTGPEVNGGAPRFYPQTHCPPGPAARLAWLASLRVGHIVVHGLVVNVLISTSPALHAPALLLFPTGEPRRAHRDSLAAPSIRPRRPHPYPQRWRHPHAHDHLGQSKSSSDRLPVL